MYKAKRMNCDKLIVYQAVNPPSSRFLSPAPLVTETDADIFLNSLCKVFTAVVVLGIHSSLSTAFEMVSVWFPCESGDERTDGLELI